MIHIRKMLFMQFFENLYQVGDTLNIQEFSNYFGWVEVIEGSQVLMESCIVIAASKEIVSIFSNDVV